MTTLHTLSELQTAVHETLTARGNLTEPPEISSSNLLLLDPHAIFSTQKKANAPTFNQILDDGLALLRTQNKEGADVLHYRFTAGELTKQVAIRLYLSEYQVKRRQQKAITQLAELIWQQEMVARELSITHLLNRLPHPTYRKMVGITDELLKLKEQLSNPKMYWVIALEGMGGLGKTAVADYLTRLAIHSLDFRQVVWVRITVTETNVRQTAVSAWKQILEKTVPLLCPESTSDPLAQQQIALMQALRKTAALIIIDNIESLDVAHSLAEQLPSFANPSKFLLTSRVTFPPTAPILSHRLSELTEEATFALLRELATEKGLVDLMEADDEKLWPIYKVTGGNPLAAKIVTGLTANLSISDILDDFFTVHMEDVEEMYNRIFRKVWQQLDEESKILMEMMPLASERGLTLEQLHRATMLEMSQLKSTIRQLINLSLIEARGSTFGTKRYGIHQLTASFIRSEIIRLKIPNSSP